MYSLLLFFIYKVKNKCAYFIDKQKESIVSYDNDYNRVKAKKTKGISN